MTKEEQNEIENDLREMFDEQLSWETAAEEINLDDGTEEYTFGKALWDKWENE
jgi:hypothetical protein